MKNESFYSSESTFVENIASYSVPLVFGFSAKIQNGITKQPYYYTLPFFFNPKQETIQTKLKNFMNGPYFIKFFHRTGQNGLRQVVRSKTSNEVKSSAAETAGSSNSRGFASSSKEVETSTQPTVKVDKETRNSWKSSDLDADLALSDLDADLAYIRSW